MLDSASLHKLPRSPISLLDFIKYGAAGFGLKVLLILVLTVLGVGKVTETIYWPWFLLGEYVLPSGPAGHAMPFGAIIGFFLGVVVYSLLIGGMTCLLKRLFAEGWPD